MPQQFLVLLVENVKYELDYYHNLISRDRDGIYAIKDASTPLDAKRLLNTIRDDGRPAFDLVVTDIRLVAEEDPDDISGVEIAELALKRNISVILMTRKEKFSAVRRILDPVTRGNLALQVNLYGKNESDEALLELVETTIRGRNVFIVHGHDHDMLSKVKSFVEDIKLYPVVLQNEVIPGTMPIFDKLKRYSLVSYVIVLMTPDDIGNALRRPEDKYLRARQNVVFELGYFIGKYTENFVAVLIPEGMSEIFKEFSDFYSMEYLAVSGDSEWKRILHKKLTLAGMDPGPLS